MFQIWMYEVMSISVFYHVASVFILFASIIFLLVISVFETFRYIQSSTLYLFIFEHAVIQ